MYVITFWIVETEALNITIALKTEANALATLEM